jgi:hemerythrin
MEDALRSFIGEEVAAEEVVDFFAEWLSGHIRKNDREFTTWLRDKGRTR